MAMGIQFFIMKIMSLETFSTTFIAFDKLDYEISKVANEVTKFQEQ